MSQVACRKLNAMREVVIVSGKRTPIGAFMGSLSSLTAPQLGSIAIKAALQEAGITGDQVDEVLMGCVLTGGMGQAPARQASKGAGIPDSVPCTTVNKVCGSGMKTIMMAAQAIKCGDADVIVAGGMESMSNAPYALPKARTGYRMGNGELVDLMIADGLWDPYDNIHMGNAGDLCGRECNISRDRQDAFAASSYERATAAQRSSVCPVLGSLDGLERVAVVIFPGGEAIRGTAANNSRCTAGTIKLRVLAEPIGATVIAH
jgi:acetyl-CoA C-acetyltransferase